MSKTLAIAVAVVSLAGICRYLRANEPPATSLNSLQGPAAVVGLSGEIDDNEIDKRIIRRDGEIVHTHMNIACSRSDGQVQFVIASLLDITERVRSEEDLRLARFCIEHAAIGIFRIAEDGHIVSVNDHTCRSLGYSREELCALTVFDIDPTFDRERWPDHRQGIRTQGSGTIETVHRRKDGSVFPVEITISYLEYEGKAFAFSFARDISKRKRAEEELRTINAELEQRVDERTRDLEEKNTELERLNRLFIGRELRMRELKEEIAVLEGAATPGKHHEE